MKKLFLIRHCETNQFEENTEDHKKKLNDNGLEDGIDQLDGVADEDGEWTFDYGNSRITHQRADNSRYYWVYNKGVQTGDNAAVGSLGNRQDL